MHGACQPVGRAQIGGALSIGDQRALGLQDGPGRCQGSRDGEGLGPIPMVSRLDMRRPILRAACGDVDEVPACCLHALEEGPGDRGSRSSGVTSVSLGVRARGCFGLGSARTSCEESMRPARRSAAILRSVRARAAARALSSRLAGGFLVRAIRADGRDGRRGATERLPSRGSLFWKPSARNWFT